MFMSFVVFEPSSFSQYSRYDVSVHPIVLTAIFPQISIMSIIYVIMQSAATCFHDVIDCISRLLSTVHLCTMNDISRLQASNVIESRPLNSCVCVCVYVRVCACACACVMLWSHC